jgi:prophage regulatory protein
MHEVRYLSPRQVEGLTSLSASHLARMADAGRFPKPVRLGEGKNGRLGFVESEVLAWNAARLEERSNGAKRVNDVEGRPLEGLADAQAAGPRPKIPFRQGARPGASA